MAIAFDLNGCGGGNTTNDAQTDLGAGHGDRDGATAREGDALPGSASDRPMELDRAPTDRGPSGSDTLTPPRPDVRGDAAPMPTDAAGSAPRTDGAVDAPIAVPDMAPPFACSDALAYPEHLACTGLYQDWATLTVDKAVREFKPGFELWSDGAAKTRWIYLPPGKAIDVTNANDWTFPVGTKSWKEFRISIGGKLKRVETRFLWKKTEDQWIRAIYRWSEDEREAPEVRDGVENVAGTGYEIPNQLACGKCHGGRMDLLLGFEALSLAQPAATGLTYTELQRQGLLASKNGNETIPATDLVPPGDDVGQKAMGYLHANCGVSCHNANTPGTKYASRIEVVNKKIVALAETDLFKTAINLPSMYQPMGAAASFYRIRPGDPARSSLPYLMNRRDPKKDKPEQMPPLASHKIDTEGVALIQNWIMGMTPAKGYPTPGP